MCHRFLNWGVFGHESLYSCELNESGKSLCELTIGPSEETRRHCDVGPGQPPDHRGMTDSNMCNNCSIQRMHYALRGQAKHVCVCVRVRACVCQRRVVCGVGGGQPWSVRRTQQ